MDDLRVSLLYKIIMNIIIEFQRCRLFSLFAVLHFMILNFFFCMFKLLLIWFVGIILYQWKNVIVYRYIYRNLLELVKFPWPLSPCLFLVCVSLICIFYWCLDTTVQVFQLTLCPWIRSHPSRRRYGRWRILECSSSKSKTTVLQ